MGLQDGTVKMAEKKQKNSLGNTVLWNEWR